MNKSTWNKFINGKIAIHFKTKYEIDNFFTFELADKDPSGGIHYLNAYRLAWNTFKEDTCLSVGRYLNIRFNSKNEYKKIGMEVIEYEVNNKPLYCQCGGKVDIFSVEKINENCVKILFMCNDCGEIFEKYSHMY